MSSPSSSDTASTWSITSDIKMSTEKNEVQTTTGTAQALYETIEAAPAQHVRSVLEMICLDTKSTVNVSAVLTEFERLAFRDGHTEINTAGNIPALAGDDQASTLRSRVEEIFPTVQNFTNRIMDFCLKLDADSLKKTRLIINGGASLSLLGKMVDASTQTSPPPSPSPSSPQSVSQKINPSQSDSDQKQQQRDEQIKLCNHCGITLPAPGFCTYHIGYRHVDIENEVWGDIFTAKGKSKGIDFDDPIVIENFAEGYRWDCCDEDGDAMGCTVNWHDTAHGIGENGSGLKRVKSADAQDEDEDWELVERHGKRVKTEHAVDADTSGYEAGEEVSITQN